MDKSYICLNRTCIHNLELSEIGFEDLCKLLKDNPEGNFGGYVETS